ncbi:hypothetical protein LTR85_000153 [Meristemomyces frigidus]|nr:hypothetical protein LTR85_000153 [Meristemomyces frigidus]
MAGSETEKTDTTGGVRLDGQSKDTIEGAIEKLSFTEKWQADIEKQRRKELYLNDYTMFVNRMDHTKRVIDYFATQNRIWTDGLLRNSIRIGELETEIEKLREQNGKMKKAAAARQQVCKDDLEKYEEDKETMKKYKAYFDLKTDELDI